MISYVDLGAGLAVVGFLTGLIWFAYRAGRNRATVTGAEAATRSADQSVQRAEAMTQAQADRPATTSALLTRLDQGDA